MEEIKGLLLHQKFDVFCLACFVPQVSLLPSTSSLLSPLQVRRNEDFYLTSIIQLSCNMTLLTMMQWTINQCSPSCIQPISVDSSIVPTTFSELFIPAQLLPVGIYEIRLTVTMNISSSLPSSASAFVSITSSGIVVNLVPLGTSMITSGYQQDLSLNPGLYSIDLDGNGFNTSVNHSS